jgi:disulfide bond formation protein DsbB
MVRAMPFPLTVAILAAAAPLLAMGSERWPGLAPCALCLWQRWPYWVAAAIALLALAMPARWRAWALRAAALAVLGSGAIAVVHVGVEFGWWPSPLPACLAPTATLGNVDDMLASLPAMPSKRCDEPAYAFEWLPLTVPQMNLLYALGLAAFIWRGAGRTPR